MTTISVTVRYVDVDVDLGDISTPDLQAELASRQKADLASGVVPPLNSEEAHPLHEIYYAFKFGLPDRATELARKYVCDELGVVL